MTTENERERVWLLTFRSLRGDPEIIRTVACREDDLLGVKAALAGLLEERNGGLWFCVKVTPAKRGEEETT